MTLRSHSAKARLVRMQGRYTITEGEFLRADRRILFAFKPRDVPALPRK